MNSQKEESKLGKISTSSGEFGLDFISLLLHTRIRKFKNYCRFVTIHWKMVNKSTRGKGGEGGGLQSSISKLISAIMAWFDWEKDWHWKTQMSCFSLNLLRFVPFFGLPPLFFSSALRSLPGHAQILVSRTCRPMTLPLEDLNRRTDLSNRKVDRVLSNLSRVKLPVF